MKNNGLLSLIKVLKGFSRLHKFKKAMMSCLLFTSTESKDIGIVLDLHIPFSNVPPDMLDLIRTALENETFPVRVSQFVEVIELNLTTGKRVCSFKA